MNNPSIQTGGGGRMLGGGCWRAGGGGGTGLVTSWQALSPPRCLFLVLIQSEWLHARRSTDWARMQIHSESRALVRMKKKHPCSSSAGSAWNREDMIALAAATETCWMLDSCRLSWWRFTEIRTVCAHTHVHVYMDNKHTVTHPPTLQNDKTSISCLCASSMEDAEPLQIHFHSAA